MWSRWARLVEDRYDLIKARQGIAPDLPEEEITSDIWGLPESERPVPIVLFVDEVAELFLTATRKDEERRDEMVTQLIRLAQLGRAAGIYLEVCGQRFGAELGKVATMLRAQLTSRVCHRVNDEASAKMALGDIAPEAVVAACEAGGGLVRRDPRAEVWRVVRRVSRERHACPPLLLRLGALGRRENIKALAEYLGNSDPGLTLRVYAHLIPSSQKRTRQPVAALYSSDRG
ncbi:MULTISPECIES: FtsK/SpoIIIE domain-containing protein [Streptomyces]|uniref:FtsK/SpoIIIE domain-containing protein n=2 Tax=Streptomyces TaxID=1883 RepID=A0ABV9J4E6_9ACTN